MIAPEVAKVASEGPGRWLVAKVNTEELPGLAQRLRINAIPLMAVFKAEREESGCDAGLSNSAICRTGWPSYVKVTLFSLLEFGSVREESCSLSKVTSPSFRKNYWLHIERLTSSLTSFCWRRPTTNQILEA
jgi:hypothetical protein